MDDERRKQGGSKGRAGKQREGKGRVREKQGKEKAHKGKKHHVYFVISPTFSTMKCKSF